MIFMKHSENLKEHIKNMKKRKSTRTNIKTMAFKVRRVPEPAIPGQVQIWYFEDFSDLESHVFYIRPCLFVFKVYLSVYIFVLCVP